MSIWIPIGAAASAATQDEAARDEVIVWGQKRQVSQAGYTGSTSVVEPQDLVSVNVVTAEDTVKYEPSLVIRRRFIGDANGTLGMRGSNMFQTSRSMVFADGVPLHYFLQSRWNGAPRWTLVSASEIARVEVIYGPFSAEYGGNAMGGVILMETAIPQRREFHADSAYFAQDFSAYGFADTLEGSKSFLSYGDKLGDFSLYFAVNHLENNSQPQTFYYGALDLAGAPAELPAGGLAGRNEIGEEVVVYGDSGIVDNNTDNLKFKGAYDFHGWQGLLNLAYEDRAATTNTPNPYLRENGAPVWSGPVGGQSFTIPGSRFAVSDMERRSLSAGLRLRGSLSESTELEANINQFVILDDETRTSARNPQDAAYTAAGSVNDFVDTGWQTADLKLSTSPLPLEGFRLVGGLRYETYELNTRVFASTDYARGSKDSKTSHSGGVTELTALFLQANWDFHARWDLSLGGRLESWHSRAGYYYDAAPAAPLQRIAVPEQNHQTFSPKFSVGFMPADEWILRYSLARAYRFPIVEELFSRFRDTDRGTDADPNLRPEDGVHQNLLVERALGEGHARFNLFHEIVEQVIENQTTVTAEKSITTFFPIDKVETWGAEWILNMPHLFLEPLSIRCNLAYTRAEILRNRANPAWEGKVPPRLPRWRGNLLATYRLTDTWDIGGNLQYAADSYGRPDNADHEDQVYGAQDGYTRFGLKTNYHWREHWQASLGVDNVTDNIAYVAHPWPGRTWYFTLAYAL